MKKYIQKITGLIKNHYIISGVVLLVLIIIIFSAGGNGTKDELFIVKQDNVVQKVIVNGKTKPVNSVNLAFETNGTVKSVFVDVGSSVTLGQNLIALDQGEAYADLLKAQANLETVKARLDEIKTGTRPEEIIIAKTEVANAEIVLSDAKNNISTKVLDSYGKSDDAVRNVADQFFTNPRSANPQFSLFVPRANLREELNSGRAEMEILLNEWKNILSDTSKEGIAKSENNLIKVSLFMDKVGEAINAQTVSSDISQTTLTAYKTSVATTRTALVTAITSLGTAKEKLNSAEASLTVAKNNLSLKESGSTPQAIRAEEAKVLQAEADVRYKEVQLSKMTLRSPQNGVVTIKSVNPGETVTPGKAVISIISPSNLELESNVSEISISKVAVGNKVNVSFDAFPGKVYYGTVTYIEPAETIIDGVVNYKVTVAFSDKYPEIKSGLTSKLEILTDTREAVLVVPQYAVITEDGKTFVLKQFGKDFMKTEVTLGLSGQNGVVEVLSGLSQGDVVNMSVSKE